MPPQVSPHTHAMKPLFCAIVLVFAASGPAARAHSWRAADNDREAMRAHILADWQQVRALNSTGEIKPVRLASASPTLNATVATLAIAASAPPQSKAFQAFPRLALRWDQDFLFVGSGGLPDHGMMVGIINWQQQVPLPQDYTGGNAWRLPLHPVPAKEPASIKGRFLRGAIALAVNGIPIFNPQNNRGEVSQEIGELDQWGGHCGRADDYHYHAAPLHLQSIVGKGQPIAYALDGYPIHGLTEPDGAPPMGLDAFHGHETAALGYHYHASTAYPYVNGGFHGEVAEVGGQVDPQPRAKPVRQDLPPLRGATITAFTSTTDGKGRSLQYKVGTRQGAVNYFQMGDGSWKFEFVATDGSITQQTYQTGPRQRGAGGNALIPAESKVDSSPQPSATFVLTSPEVADGGKLPVDYTGDGSGATLPLTWTGAPAGTQGYVLIMDHLDPEGSMKWYWTLYDIPPGVTSLPKNVKGVGKVGTGFKGSIGYEPPHSKGPGAKTYVLTVYALSSPLKIRQAPDEVNREVLVSAMKGKVLASASLHVVHSRGGEEAAGRPSPAEQGGGSQHKPWMQTHGVELDEDHDGIVTAGETIAAMKRAFALYDRDHDGAVTPSEIDAAGEIRDGGAFAGMIYRHAIELDADNDSRLTLEEAIAAASYLFASADEDHDGRLTTAEIQSAANAPLPIPSAHGRDLPVK